MLDIETRRSVGATRVVKAAWKEDNGRILTHCRIVMFGSLLSLRLTLGRIGLRSASRDPSMCSGHIETLAVPYYQVARQTLPRCLQSLGEGGGERQILSYLKISRCMAHRTNIGEVEACCELGRGRHECSPISSGIL